MSEYITLLGTQRVEHASQEMRAAAVEMTRAAREIGDAVMMLRRILEDDREARKKVVPNGQTQVQAKVQVPVRATGGSLS